MTEKIVAFPGSRVPTPEAEVTSDEIITMLHRATTTAEAEAVIGIGVVLVHPDGRVMTAWSYDRDVIALLAGTDMLHSRVLAAVNGD